MKTQELAGYWWLPEQSDAPLAGTLILSEEDGVKLNLMGFFGSKLELHGIEDMPEHPIVLGVIQNGKEVTLEDTHAIGMNMSFPGFPTLNLSAKAAYVGGHFGNEDELRFHEARLETNHLLGWIGQSRFHRRIPLQERITEQPFEIGFSLPEPVRALLPDGEMSVGQ